MDKIQLGLLAYKVPRCKPIDTKHFDVDMASDWSGC